MVKKTCLFLQGVAGGKRMSGLETSELLLFADDVVLLASSEHDLQRALEWFAAKCEAVGMRVSTSKSEAIVLCRNRWIAPSRWGKSYCLK